MGKNVSSAIIRFESIYGNATIHIIHPAKLCVCVLFFASFSFEVNFYLVTYSLNVRRSNLIQKGNLYVHTMAAIRGGFHCMISC